MPSVWLADVSFDDRTIRTGWARPADVRMFEMRLCGNGDSEISVEIALHASQE